jgi:hypothetical protein
MVSTLDKVWGIGFVKGLFFKPRVLDPWMRRYNKSAHLLARINQKSSHHYDQTVHCTNYSGYADAHKRSDRLGLRQN